MNNMNKWILIFLVVTVVSWLIGFTGLTVLIIKLARLVFFISAILLIGAVAMHFMKKPGDKI